MNILFIVPYVPTPIRTRPYNLVRALARRGHAITLATLWENEAERLALDVFAQDGIRVISEQLPRGHVFRNLLQVLPTRLPLQARYSWMATLAERLLPEVRAGQFDAIHVEHLRGVEYALFLQAQIRDRRLPIVWDSVDCISLLFEQAVRYSKSRFGKWATMFDLPRTRRYEAWLVRQFSRILVTSQADRIALEQLAAPVDPLESHRTLAEITVLPNGVDAEQFAPQVSPRNSSRIVFSGKMSYHANVTAAYHLIEAIMPLVWRERPDADVWIVGKEPAGRLLDLARDNPRVNVTGEVPDLAGYIYQAAVSAAPIVYGAGIQNKVLEAMACGTPVVASLQAAQALQAVPGQDFLVADGAEAFAAALLRLLNDEQLRQQLGENGRRYVMRYHDWNAVAGQLETIYQEASNGYHRKE